MVDGEHRWNYRDLRERCRRLAGALVGPAGGRPVAVLAPNTHVLLEASFGVPWAGVPLVAVNALARFVADGSWDQLTGQCLTGLNPIAPVPHYRD
ncbi:AMP-binding enzyme [Frankia sp. EI5c]|uniref:AMP-binding protein n=1 Tax=Frankia sp. EI5c TaxID=683316 RepID=UPI0007C39C53|nr:AMP-binding enzyme [Frankia sp. EI5c]